MICIKISNVKKMMADFLINNTFDDFYLSSLSLSTFANFSIDGSNNVGWDEEVSRYNYWKRIKPLAYEIVKGKKSPSKIKAIMVASDSIKEKFLALLDEEFDNDFIITIKYEEDQLSIVTGISMKTFSIGNNISKVWDNAVTNLLDQADITYEVL